MNSRFFPPLSVFLFPVSLFSSALGDLAASMKAGEWKALPTNNMVATLSANGASGCVIGGYHEDLAWDPVTQQILVISGDHNWGENTSQFVTYSAATNTWQREPRPSWLGILHGYDHNAIDVVGRRFIFRSYGGTQFDQYDIDSKTWTTLPDFNVNDYVSCCFGVEYFPEMKGIFVTNTQGGSCHFLKDGASQWTRLGSITAGGYQDFAEYNPVHKVMLFGGSNGSSALYKYDSAGTVTKLKNAPRTLGVNQSINTVDPVSGDYLFFFDDATFYTYDITSETWTKQTGTVPAFTPNRSGPIWHLTATPVADHGVVLFAKFYYSSPSQAWVYLYKHSGVTGKEGKGQTAYGKGQIAASPNPFQGQTTLTLAPEISRLRIYGPDGRCTASFHGNGPFSWRPRGLAPGVYLAQARAGRGVVTSKIIYAP